MHVWPSLSSHIKVLYEVYVQYIVVCFTRIASRGAQIDANFRLLIYKIKCLIQLKCTLNTSITVDIRFWYYILLRVPAEENSVQLDPLSRLYYRNVWEYLCRQTNTLGRDLIALGKLDEQNKAQIEKVRTGLPTQGDTVTVFSAQNTKIEMKVISLDHNLPSFNLKKNFSTCFYVNYSSK